MWYDLAIANSAMIEKSISYEAARMMAIKSENLVGTRPRLHDLRRHSDTYASCSGVFSKFVSKVILSHANPSIAQRYLGIISDVGVIR